MKVKVYKNLHRDCYSVLDSSGKVCMRVHDMYLSLPRFTVRQSGRERVIKEGMKNVHAFVVGFISEKHCNVEWRKVKYNPYLFKSFVYDDDNTPVGTHKVCKIDKTGVYVG